MDNKTDGRTGGAECSLVTACIGQCRTITFVFLARTLRLMPGRFDSRRALLSIFVLFCFLFGGYSRVRFRVRPRR